MMKINHLSIAVKLLLIGGVSTAYANTEAVDLGTQVIVVSADASKVGLLSTAAGEQVALGGRVGLLGNKTNLTTPFSTIAYTNDYIQNQQADSVGDVLKRDPTVQVARGFGNFQESYMIRGFVTNSDDTMMNGLYGIMPRQYIASDLFERVEVQRGAGTFLNGVAPGGTNKGGTINLLPKRAGNAPIRKVSLSTVDGENAKISVDVGQRFYDDKVGVRTTVAVQSGGTAIDNEKEKLGLIATGLDYKDDKARLSMDLGYQDNRLKAKRTNVTPTAGIPTAPKADSNWAQDWTYSNEKDVFGTLRGEYDLAQNVTAFAAYGFRRGDEENSLANLDLTDAQGNGSVYRFDNARKDNVNTAEAGVRGSLMTGNVKHEWTVSGNIYQSKEKNAYRMDFFNRHANSLHNPSKYGEFAWSNPFNGFAGNDLNNPALTGEKNLRSIAVADTISAFDNKLQTTIGLRHQTIDTKSYNYGTGDVGSAYKQSKTTPALAVIYRPTRTWSVYANYAQNLSQGEIAPATNGTEIVSNAGQVMKPAVTEQIEAGVKYYDGDLGAGLTVFKTDKPRYRTQNGVFTDAGKNVHQGVELSVYGEPVERTRVLGGVSFYDTKQQNTGSADSEGKQVLGVPKTQFNLGVEHDVAGIEGLTLTGDLTHTGKRFADAANTLSVAGFTTLDVGGRYKTNIAGKDVALKATIANLTNKKHWVSVGGYENSQGENGAGYLNAGEPRSVKLSASVDF